MSAAKEWLASQLMWFIVKRLMKYISVTRGPYGKVRVKFNGFTGIGIETIGKLNDNEILFHRSS
jgi:hypothetical protein